MKRLYAFVIFVLAMGGIAIVAASLATQEWGISLIERDNETCSVQRIFGLFTGIDSGTDFPCNLVDQEYSLLTENRLNINQGLIFAQIAICCATIFFGLFAATISAYNLCFRPYESWAGPYGLIAYFSIGSVFYLISVILFVVNGFTDLTDTVSSSCNFTTVCKDEGFQQLGFSFGYSFFVFVAAFGLFFAGIVTVIMGEKSLSKRVKNKLCPGQLEEPEIDQGGKDNNIMMF